MNKQENTIAPNQNTMLSTHNTIDSKITAFPSKAEESEVKGLESKAEQRTYATQVARGAQTTPNQITQISRTSQRPSYNTDNRPGFGYKNRGNDRHYQKDNTYNSNAGSRFNGSRYEDRNNSSTSNQESGTGSRSDRYQKHKYVKNNITEKEKPEELIENIAEYTATTSANKSAEVLADREVIELPESINDFEEMKFLSQSLFRGIYEYGFKYPSPIQAQTIHIINSGCDLIAQSQSGSGKTGAFAIGSLSRIDPKLCYPQVLMIANTRLLALQIHKVVETISKHMGIDVSVCIGGGHKNNSHMNPQQIKNSHVIVGTPGRICDMLKRHLFDGKKIKTFIMDESDVLLKDDFQEQIIDIVHKLGDKTQICIFSATFTKDTLMLTEKFLRDPYRVTVEKENVSVKGIKQYAVNVKYEKFKFETLLDLFAQLSFNQMIIFVRSIKNAEELRNSLIDKNIHAGLVHGKMNSIDRENVLKEFRLSYIKILISTDVMCRGIDIDDLRIVINYDMPEENETYIHRVGRSGRYGGQGVALNFCTVDDMHKINVLNREFQLGIVPMPNPEEVNLALVGMAPPEGKVSSAKNYSY